MEPTYHAVHTTLTHPAYAGAYVYGRTRKERYLGPDGALRKRRRRLPRDQWEVLIPDHHPGFIDWDTYQANQARIGANIRPAGPPAGHRRGPGRLRAAAGPGHLRHLRPQARRSSTRPGQDASRTTTARVRELVDGRGARHMSVGGQAIDAAVAEAFLAALQPAALQACLQAARQLEARPRRRPGPAPAPGRAGPLPRRPGRAPLPGGRPG